MSIIQKLGEDNIKLIAKPSFVDTNKAEFQEALAKFVLNNSRTEARRNGSRTVEKITNDCIRGLVAEFAFKQIEGVEDSSPLVNDIRELEYARMMVDQKLDGYRFQTKSTTGNSKYWSFNQNQCRSISHSSQYNDFFLVIAVNKETDDKWLAVPRLLIDAHHISRGIQKSQYNAGFYFNPEHSKKFCIQLTNYLKLDRIKELEECT